MKRPEILTAAVVAAVGLGFALWLAANRVPPTPAPPAAPEGLSHALTLEGLPDRTLPEATAEIALPDRDLGVDGLACGPVFSAEPGAEGFVRLAVDAPCRAGERVDISLGPVRFAALLSERGTLRVAVPRLPGSGKAVARLGERVLEAETPYSGTLPAISGLSWSSPADLSISAYEFGAAAGGRGHVTLRDQRGVGRVLRLGDPGLGDVTEVYIGPEDAGPGVVRLHVVARARGAGCAEILPLVAFEAYGARLQERDIRLSLDGCDDTILLKNLLEDLKIADR